MGCSASIVAPVEYVVQPDRKPRVELLYGSVARTPWSDRLVSKYIPRHISSRFAFEPLGSHLVEPEVEHFEAAVAFIDVSGFTKLSEMLVRQHGKGFGAEQLNTLISEYFDKLIEIIEFFGGDVIKFAGDAMQVLWRNPYIPGSAVRGSLLDTRFCFHPPPARTPVGPTLAPTPHAHAHPHAHGHGHGQRGSSFSGHAGGSSVYHAQDSNDAAPGRASLNNSSSNNAGGVVYGPPPPPGSSGSGSGSLSTPTAASLSHQAVGDDIQHDAAPFAPPYTPSSGGGYGGFGPGPSPSSAGLGRGPGRGRGHVRSDSTAGSVISAVSSTGLPRLPLPALSRPATVLPYGSGAATLAGTSLYSGGGVAGRNSVADSVASSAALPPLTITRKPTWGPDLGASAPQTLGGGGSFPDLHAPPGGAAGRLQTQMQGRRSLQRPRSRDRRSGYGGGRSYGNGNAAVDNEEEDEYDSSYDHDDDDHSTHGGATGSSISGFDHAVAPPTPLAATAAAAAAAAAATTNAGSINSNGNNNEDSESEILEDLYNSNINGTFNSNGSFTSAADGPGGPGGGGGARGTFALTAPVQAERPPLRWDSSRFSLGFTGYYPVPIVTAMLADDACTAAATAAAAADRSSKKIKRKLEKERRRLEKEHRHHLHCQHYYEERVAVDAATNAGIPVADTDCATFARNNAASSANMRGYIKPSVVYVHPLRFDSAKQQDGVDVPTVTKAVAAAAKAAAEAAAAAAAAAEEDDSDDDGATTDGDGAGDNNNNNNNDYTDNKGGAKNNNGKKARATVANAPGGGGGGNKLSRGRAAMAPAPSLAPSAFEACAEAAASEAADALVTACFASHSGGYAGDANHMGHAVTADGREFGLLSDAALYPSVNNNNNNSNGNGNRNRYGNNYGAARNAGTGGGHADSGGDDAAAGDESWSSSSGDTGSEIESISSDSAESLLSDFDFGYADPNADDDDIADDGDDYDPDGDHGRGGGADGDEGGLYAVARAANAAAAAAGNPRLERQRIRRARRTRRRRRREERRARSRALALQSGPGARAQLTPGPGGRRGTPLVNSNNSNTADFASPTTTVAAQLVTGRRSLEDDGDGDGDADGDGDGDSLDDEESNNDNDWGGNGGNAVGNGAGSSASAQQGSRNDSASAAGNAAGANSSSDMGTGTGTDTGLGQGGSVAATGVGSSSGALAAGGGGGGGSAALDGSHLASSGRLPGALPLQSITALRRAQRWRRTAWERARTRFAASGLAGRGLTFAADGAALGFLTSPRASYGFDNMPGLLNSPLAATAGNNNSNSNGSNNGSSTALVPAGGKSSASPQQQQRQLQQQQQQSQQPNGRSPGADEVIGPDGLPRFVRTDRRGLLNPAHRTLTAAPPPPAAAQAARHKAAPGLRGVGVMSSAVGGGHLLPLRVGPQRFHDGFLDPDFVRANAAVYAHRVRDARRRAAAFGATVLSHQPVPLLMLLDSAHTQVRTAPGAAGAVGASVSSGSGGGGSGSGCAAPCGSLPCGDEDYDDGSNTAAAARARARNRARGRAGGDGGEGYHWLSGRPVTRLQDRLRVEEKRGGVWAVKGHQLIQLTSAAAAAAAVALAARLTAAHVAAQANKVHQEHRARTGAAIATAAAAAGGRALPAAPDPAAVAAALAVRLVPAVKGDAKAPLVPVPFPSLNGSVYMPLAKASGFWFNAVGFLQRRLMHNLRRLRCTAAGKGARMHPGAGWLAEQQQRLQRRAARKAARARARAASRGQDGGQESVISGDGYDFAESVGPDGDATRANKKDKKDKKPGKIASFFKRVFGGKSKDGKDSKDSKDTANASATGDKYRAKSPATASKTRRPHPRAPESFASLHTDIDLGGKTGPSSGAGTGTGSGDGDGRAQSRGALSGSGRGGGGGDSPSPLESPFSQQSDFSGTSPISGSSSDVSSVYTHPAYFPPPVAAARMRRLEMEKQARRQYGVPDTNTAPSRHKSSAKTTDQLSSANTHTNSNTANDTGANVSPDKRNRNINNNSNTNNANVNANTGAGTDGPRRGPSRRRRAEAALDREMALERERSGAQYFHEPPVRVKLMSLHELTLRATLCCLVLLQHQNALVPGAIGSALRLHMGIGAGLCSGFMVGGFRRSWEFYIAGDPVTDMSLAANEAQAGQLVLAQSAYHFMRDRVVGHPTRDDLFIVQRLRGRYRVKPHHAALKPRVSADEALLDFVPPLIRHRLDTSTSTTWLAEYRTVTVAFAKLVGVDYSDPCALSRIQLAVQVIQAVISEHMGSIARLLCDDKGTRFKIVFGMPSQSHSDDTVRAVRACSVMSNIIAQSATGLRLAIGVATGPVFVGNAGSEQRCEYTAVGSTVILAARLCEKAHEHNYGVVVEELTYNLSNMSISFAQLPSVILKNITTAVPIFRPMTLLESADGALSAHGLSSSNVSVYTGNSSSSSGSGNGLDAGGDGDNLKDDTFDSNADLLARGFSASSLRSGAGMAAMLNNRVWPGGLAGGPRGTALTATVPTTGGSPVSRGPSSARNSSVRGLRGIGVAGIGGSGLSVTLPDADAGLGAADGALTERGPPLRRRRGSVMSMTTNSNSAFEGDTDQGSALMCYVADQRGENGFFMPEQYGYLLRWQEFDYFRCRILCCGYVDRYAAPRMQGGLLKLENIFESFGRAITSSSISDSRSDVDASGSDSASRSGAGNGLGSGRGGGTGGLGSGGSNSGAHGHGGGSTASGDSTDDGEDIGFPVIADAPTDLPSPMPPRRGMIFAGSPALNAVAGPLTASTPFTLDSQPLPLSLPPS